MFAIARGSSADLVAEAIAQAGAQVFMTTVSDAGLRIERET